MSKKNKKKSVSQAELREMMKEMKKNRGEGVTKKRVYAAVTDKDIAAIQEKRLKLLNQPKKKSVTFSAKNDKSDSVKVSEKSRNGDKVPKKSNLKHKNEEFSKPSKRTKTEKVTKSGLPANFFDDGHVVDVDTNVAMETEDKKDIDQTAPSAGEENKSSIPEGFFDDPNADAKTRGVETPADAMDREWESFKREMQKEETQSEQIIEEFQETDNIDRQIDEIDEQLRCYSRVERLNDRKDAIRKVKMEVKREVTPSSGEDSSDDEDDMDISGLDWREKDAFL